MKTKEKKSVNKYRSIGYNLVIRLIVPAILVLLWWCISSAKVFSPLVMPPLSKIGQALTDSLSSGLLVKDLAASLSIVLQGYLIGSLLGLIAGFIMGIVPRVKDLFEPVFNGLRQIPPLAWIPLLILWFGIGSTSKVVLIATGSFFPVLLNTINGVATAAQGLLEFAQVYKIKRKDVLWHIYLPGALPSIFVGLRLGLSTAWMSIVAVEMIAASAGVGYRINDARNLMQPEVVIFYMIVIGCVGGLMDLAIKLITRYVLRWQRQ